MKNLITNKHRGFTLVEVIVVLVILAILAAILLPSLIGYIQKSESSVCKVELGGIIRQYSAHAAYNRYQVSDSGPLLEASISEYNGKLIDASHFTASCGGVCTVTFSSDLLSITSINCSIHGNVSEVEVPSSASSALNNATKIVQGKECLDKIAAYVSLMADKNKTKDSLDSTGVNYAPAINDYLKGVGIDTDQSGWRIWYDTSRDYYEIYWTDTNLNSATPNQNLRYVKIQYNYKTDEIAGSAVSGTMPVIFDTEKQLNVLAPSNPATTVDEQFGDSWE